MIIKKRKIERNDKRGAVTKSISIFFDIHWFNILESPQKDISLEINILFLTGNFPEN